MYLRFEWDTVRISEASKFQLVSFVRTFCVVLCLHITLFASFLHTFCHFLCIHFLCLLPVPTSYLFQENGKVDFSVPAEEYRRMLRYRFDPFCVTSSIKIFTEGEERGRGTKFNHTASVPLVPSLVRFSFDEAMPRMFRPGMEYPVMVSGFVSPCFVYAYVHMYIHPIYVHVLHKVHYKYICT